MSTNSHENGTLFNNVRILCDRFHYTLLLNLSDGRKPYEAIYIAKMKAKEYADKFVIPLLRD